MKDGDKHFYSLLFLNLKVSFRFECFSSASRRGFCTNTSAFFFYLYHIPRSMEAGRSVLQAGRAEAALPGCQGSSWGSGCCFHGMAQAQPFRTCARPAQTGWCAWDWNINKG